MEEHRDAYPEEVRKRVLGIPNEIKLVRESGKFEIKVDGRKLQSLDKLLYLDGSRISEVVTVQRPSDKLRALNTGTMLKLKMDEYEGEEVAVFNLVTLKRKDHVLRAVALPMDRKYEPWTKDIVSEWDRGNPYDIQRQWAWEANRIVFDGLYYTAQSVTKTPVVNKKRLWDYHKKLVSKPLSDQGMRHIRIKDLIQNYGFGVLEVQRFVGWTSSTANINQMMDIYFNMIWRDYFPKMLKVYKGEA
jgi:hypothetical protein